jgi:carboxymethylenebutenolidase
MCYGDDARAPQPPTQGPVGASADTTLTSADGTRFMAHHADAASGATAAVVILPDVRGLHFFYRDLAVRFAEAGLHAIAIDYFGRTAGTDDRSESFEYRAHVEKLELSNVNDDVAAATAWLRERHRPRAVFTLGFCLGGGLSWAQSAAGHALSGCIGFYGRPERAEALIAYMRAPLLLLAAGQDFTPVSAVEEFAGKVRDTGLTALMHVYPDAPHSFFDRTFAEHAQDCADAWRHILAFIDEQAGSPAE